MTLLLEDKIRSIQLATALGPVVPYAGIIDGHCSCLKQSGCRRPGKHPFGKNWRQDAIVDLHLIEETLSAIPELNFAIMMGKQAICVDLDVRPDKNGVEYLSSQGTLPETVTVQSGGGGLHLFFKIPSDIHTMFSDKKHGVDLIRKGVVMAPGSLHLSGSHYRWVHSPLEAQLLEVPEWIKELLQNTDSRALDDAGAIGGPGVAHPSPDGISSGRIRPDWVVKREWLKHTKAGATQGHRSDQDASNAAKLAFYCSHHWEQFLRIWGSSPEVWSGKKYRNVVDHLLAPAFKANPGNWVSKNKHRQSLDKAANPKLARAMRRTQDKLRSRPVYPRSPSTKAVITLHQQEPSLTDRQIAERLGMQRNSVKRIRHRYPDLWS